MHGRGLVFRSGLAAGVAGLAALLLPLGAYAVDVPVPSTVTLTSGALEFVTDPEPTNFNGTITGQNQTLDDDQAIDVRDATGSGAGWNLNATSTQFATSGGATLPTNATTITAGPTVACDVPGTCTLPTNGINYPYTLPAGPVAPAQTRFYNAAANTGMGQMTVSAVWNVTIPGSATAGTYNSTWTIGLDSGP